MFWEVKNKMSVPSNWLFGLIVIWVVVVLLCAFTVGAQIPVGTADTLTEIANPDATLAAVPNIYGTLTSIFGWGGTQMTFFADGIGLWIRIFLLALSAAIVLPLAFDTIRLILPWKS